MIDDCYQLALAAITHHLDEAGTTYELDEGDILVGGHRLGLSITFEEFVRQAGETIAPLDIQIHLDGDTGDCFRMGTLGVGGDQATALRAAVAEWHLLAAAPLLAALGAAVELRKTRLPQQLAGWDFFPGRIGVRGRMPPELDPSAPFFRSLLEVLRGRPRLGKAAAISAPLDLPAGIRHRRGQGSPSRHRRPVGRNPDRTACRAALAPVAGRLSVQTVVRAPQRGRVTFFGHGPGSDALPDGREWRSVKGCRRRLVIADMRAKRVRVGDRSRLLQTKMFLNLVPFPVSR